MCNSVKIVRGEAQELSSVVRQVTVRTRQCAFAKTTHHAKQSRSLHASRAIVAALLAIVAYFSAMGAAQAIPSFTRKYETSCQTCHVHYPILNSFGEAFRRNGYRFPGVAGSVDSDAAKEETLAMGQPETADSFPNTVLPSQISKSFPLSAVVSATLPYSLPQSDLRKNSGNAFNWDGLQGSVSLYAAGSFTDNLTYFMKGSFVPGATAMGPAYLLWNDIFGPRHLVNLWIGRLVTPQLTSYVSSGGYLDYRAFPTVSVAGLFNGNHAFILGQGPVNGAELNGILFHRLAYSFGWLSSSFQTGLSAPTSQDFYGHIGTKVGGASLDGEGPNGMSGVDLVKPWEETALTIDVFGYRGVAVADNFTNYPATTAQSDPFTAVGIAARLQLRAFVANVILQQQNHFRPYAGADPTTVDTVTLPGIPDNSPGKGSIGSAELSYVVFPWLVPALRAEHTVLDSGWGTGSFSRLMPGFSALLRPNLRIYAYADMQHAHRTPPQPKGYSTTWLAASATANPPKPAGERRSVESINASLSMGF